MAHAFKDLNRKGTTLTTSKVNEVLPEFYDTEYPKLISFLKEYYNFLDSNETYGFGEKVKELIHSRDASQNNTESLNSLIQEIGNGIQSSTFFQQPRLMAKLLADFYRAKGSRNSAEGFFRGFFGIEAEIEYPKDKLFIVGTSNVGPESDRFLPNETIYQTFSILVKCGLSSIDYENLYKRFVHPAGFHFAGEVLAVNEGLVSLSAVGTDPLDSAPPRNLHEEVLLLPTTGITQMTRLIDSGAHVVRVADASWTDDSIPFGMISMFYENLRDLTTPNSFKFDDSCSLQPNTRQSYPGDDSANMALDSYSNNATGWSSVAGMSADSANGRFVDTTYWATYSDGNRSFTRGYWKGATRDGPASTNLPLGTLAGTNWFNVDYTNTTYFDSSYFVNPGHIIDSGNADWQDSHYLSRTLPGLMVYGEKYFGAAHRGLIYRFDSDLYYWQSGVNIPNTGIQVSAGAYHNKIGNYFTISKLHIDGKDNPGPDFSLNQETMDNEMFTRYISDSAY